MSRRVIEMDLKQTIIAVEIFDKNNFRILGKCKARDFHD